MLLALGLVAALALPKMAEQQALGRVVQLRQAAQGMETRLAAVRERAQRLGLDCQDPAPRSMRFEDETVTLQHCQPQAGADLALVMPTWAALQSADGWRLAPPQISAPRLVLERSDAPQPTACALSYTPAQAGEPARVELFTTGC